MRKSWMWIACGVAFVGASMVSNPQDAQARPGYLKGFNTAYPALKDAAEAAKCGVCHFGDKKTNRNDYGKAQPDFLSAGGCIEYPKIVPRQMRPPEANKASDCANSLASEVRLT